MTDIKQLVQQELSAGGLFLDTEVRLDAGSPVMASPSWWGADSDHWIVDDATPNSVGSDRVFVKVMQQHSLGYVDVGASFRAAVAAGLAGIGPRVRHSNAATGVLVMDDLGQMAATATLDLFDDVEAIERLVHLRRAVHALPPFTRTSTVFEDLDAALLIAQHAGSSLPVDLDWMLRALDPARSRIASSGFDAVPCHGDGNVSNVMVVEEGASLRLVDWDCAAMMDPLQDLGVLLAELAPSDLEARPVFEMYWGEWDSSLFDRSRIYGIADSLKWGLIGSFVDVIRPGTLEYSKFADWQFLRARIGLRDQHFDDRVRNL